MKRFLRKLSIFTYGIEQKLFGGKGLGKFPLAQKIKKAVFSFVQPKTAEVGDLKIHLDAVRGFLDPGRYKLQVAELLKRELRGGQTALDLGANIGYFTCLMAQLTGPGGKVFAFEPDPDNLKLLRKNAVENGLENIVIIPAAVADGPGKIKFFESGVHGALGYDATGNAESGGGIEVDVVRLDDFFADGRIQKVDLIKMDIIGSEGKALTGMRKLLKENGNIKIVSAFCPAFLRGAGSDPVSYLNVLTSLGFKIYDIAKNKEITPADFSVFSAKYDPRGKIAQAEIYCVR